VICHALLSIMLILYRYAVPVENIDKEEMGIVFDAADLRKNDSEPTEKSTASESIEEDAKSKSIDESAESKVTESKATEDDGATDSTDESEKNKSTEKPKEEDDMLCSHILEKKLIELYANVDPSTTDLLLCMKPLSSKLQNVFSVIFTREIIEEDASLVEKGRSMRYASRVTRDPLEVTRMLNDLDEKGKPIALFTVIADVSIQCLEAFAVTDKTTGDIVSGSKESQEVTHLVRFEVTTNLEGGRHLGEWRIVDWDDLLEGNVWY